MKKMKFLFVIMLGVLLLPFSVFAEDADTNKENETQQTEKVKLYFFHGTGCPHCEDAEKFFTSIEEEYGQYFEVKEYETWYNTDNADLMEKVAKTRKEEVSGVPYIIIGNQSWNGFTEEYGEEMKEAIKSEYEKSSTERYDIMELLDNPVKEEKNYATDVLVLVIIVLVAAGIVGSIVYARKRTV